MRFGAMNLTLFHLQMEIKERNLLKTISVIENGYKFLRVPVWENGQWRLKYIEWMQIFKKKKMSFTILLNLWFLCLKQIAYNASQRAVFE